MLGRNQSGQPDSKDYLLGRACVFISELDATTGVATCYRPVGNTPALTVSVDVEELTHRASHCKAFGGAVIDRRLIISQTLNLSMTLEELNHENVGVFFQGTVDAPANPAVAGIGAYNITTTLALNCWYPIIDPATGIRALDLTKTDLTITEDPAGVPVVLTVDDDYVVDEAMGLVMFQVGTAVLAGGEIIEIVLAAKPAAAATIERVNALKASQIRYAVKVLVENANNLDELVEMEFHSVLLTGDGDLGVVSDELAQMNLAGVAEANTDMTGNPTLTISKAV